MYNKNKFRKVNDKKLLRKKGKKWVVMSAALLAMIGGGALAGHATHAASVNSNNNAHQSTTQLLTANTKGTNTTASANQQSAAPVQHQSTAQKPVVQQPVQNATQNTAQHAQAQTNANTKQTATAPAQNTNSASATAAKSKALVAPQVSTKSAVSGSVASSKSAAPEVGQAQTAAKTFKASVGATEQNTVPSANTVNAGHSASNNSVHNANTVAGNKEVRNSSVKNQKLATANTKPNIHINNGMPNVDGNAMPIMSTNDLGGSNPDSTNRNGVTNDNAASAKEVQAAGNNNEDLGTDPFESNPYNPMISVDFANVANNDAPVGDTDTIQAHANDQLTINKDGSVTLNGQTVSAPKGFTVAPYTDSTYTSGTYTVLPRMFDKKSSTWSSEDYTVGVQPINQANSNANLGAGFAGDTTTTAADADTTTQAQARPHMLLGNPNNVTGSTGDDDGGGDGGGSNNNNIVPNGSTVNNNDRDNGDYDDHDDAEFAALINNQDRDGQDALNRMEASGQTAVQNMADEASAEASNSAKAVSMSENGQDATTIQSMNDSSEAQSLKNEVAEQSDEQSLQNSYSNDMSQFRNDIDNQRATLNKAGTNALDELSQLTNLTPDQSNQVADQLQSAESTYLGQLSHAQNQAQWDSVSNNYTASLDQIMSDAQETNDNNKNNGTNSAANAINDASSKINDLIDSNNDLTSGEKSSLKAKFSSDAANASNMASSNADSSDVVSSVVNSLDNDYANVTSEGSSNATSNSNEAQDIAEAQKMAQDNKINNDRNNAINRVNEDPNLLPATKAQYDAEINAEANKAIAENGGVTTNGTNQGTDLANSTNGSSNNANTNAINPEAETPEQQMAMAGIAQNATLAQAQGIGFNDVNQIDANDKAFVGNNTTIPNVQKSLMGVNLDRMANGGIALIHQATNVPSVANDVAIIRANMDRYAGNIQDYNPANIGAYPSYFDAYDYDAGLPAYGTGLEHYDATEYANEANLANQYKTALAQGFGMNQLPSLNEQAFNYGASDAANSTEAYPGLTQYEPYRAGHYAYASGFNDGRYGKPMANLINYSALYRDTYGNAYRAGVNYRYSSGLAETNAYKNGYKSSHAHRLAAGNIAGHSVEFVRGYIKGLNARLSRRPIYVMVNHNAMLHSSPEFTKGNRITELSHATELIVNGASVDAYGNVRYHVMAIGAGGMSITRRLNGWISASHNVVHDTYYRANGLQNHSDRVLIQKNCLIHSTAGEWSPYETVAHLHRGKIVHIRGIVRCGSITRFYIAPGQYITTNKAFVQWLR